MSSASCRLCPKEGVLLRESHIIPAWAYKRLRDPAASNGNPNPVRINDGKRAVQISKQITEAMLCTDCEQKIGHVENVVSAFVNQSDGSKPLRDGLSVSTVDAATIRHVQRAVAPDALVEYLRWFGLSVLWRAHHSREIDRCSLGPYEAPLRAYLHSGAALGDHFLTVLTYLDDPADMPAGLGFTTPVSNPFPDHANLDLHWFHFFGVRFDVFVGEGIPGVWRELWEVHPAMILVSTSERMLLPHLVEMVADAERLAATPRRK
jgi:hypothetical protein